MENSNENPIMIIDGMNFFIRSYTSSPLMVAGEHVGGTIGFLNSLLPVISKHKPQRCFVIWEGGGSTRRRQIYPNYKGGRRPHRLNRFYEGEMPDSKENRDWQLKFLVEILKKVPISQIYISDCEADDIIGYLSKYTFRKNNVLIVSSDHDYLQLIDDRVKIWSPTLKVLVDKHWVLEKYGILPHNLCVARCFSGDSSDELPGLKGVGIKTLIKRFPKISSQDLVSVEEILEMSKNHPDLEKVKMIRTIVEGSDIARRNWLLMHLDVSNLSGNQINKLNSILEFPPPKGNKIELMRLLLKYEIKTFDVDRFYVQVNSILNRNMDER